MKDMDEKSRKLIADPSMSVFLLPMKSASPPPIRLKTIDTTDPRVKIIPTTDIGMPRTSSKYKAMNGQVAAKPNDLTNDAMLIAQSFRLDSKKRSLSFNSDVPGLIHGNIIK
jgi:hypothetical protein